MLLALRQQQPGIYLFVCQTTSNKPVAAITTKPKNDQLAIDRPKNVQSILVQSPLPLKIIGMARFRGKVSIMPYRSRPQLAISGGYHCKKLCRGRDLYGMIETFPLKRAIPMIFKGSGDCTKIDWTFLGLSIANWSFLGFVVIAATGLLLVVRQMKR